MFKSALKTAVFVLFAVGLVSCSANNAAKNDSFDVVKKDAEKPVAKEYTIKRATGKVELTTDWNAGQWARANVLRLGYYMGKKPEHIPRVQAKMLYDNDYIYVFFKSNDQYVRSVATKYHGKVWEDSCAEFFFNPNYDIDNVFMNLEMNCGGTFLFCYHDETKKTERYVDIDDCKKIEVVHSMPSVVDPEITEPTTWTLCYKVPFDVIGKYSDMVRPKSGVKWKANLYNCADKTSHPHWLTWSYVDNPFPSFHLPAYFGVLNFE